MSKDTSKINHLHPHEAKWFAIYTKYKCEKYVVDLLDKKGVCAYIPLINKTKKYTRKTKHYKVPLINCYAFVFITRDQYIPVLETQYVSGFVKQRNNHLISIPQGEIDILKRVVGEIENVQSGPISFSKGEMVEVIGGNLTGLKGRLIEKHGSHAFVVRLDTVGLQLEMVINKSLLSPLSAPLSA